MAQKRIIDLLSTSYVDGNSLLLVRNTTTNKDNSVSVDNFVKSIGNPAIKGFVAVVSDNNHLTLHTSNGKGIDKYYDGMTVSFISPITSDGNVQLRLGSLNYINFYESNSTKFVELENNKFYEAVYTGNSLTGNFYWTNQFIKEEKVYIDGFNASSIGPNNLVLTPAGEYDIKKYYDGMIVSFVSPVNSNGIVQLSFPDLNPRSFYKYDSAETVVLENNKYYEAIYRGDEGSGGFYWTNEYLSSSNGITYTSGYKATTSGQDAITLTPSSGFEVTQYYDGMTVSFVSPITANSITLKVGTLSPKPVYSYGSNTNTQVVTGDYIEAIYVGTPTQGKFYKTNEIYDNSTIFSNEYLATSNIVDSTNGPTDLTLTSAIGAKKPYYYQGMSLLFRVPVGGSVGNVTVNVDNLGPKNLNDGPDDKIQNDLIEGQFILAVYDGTQFIKNRFEFENPPIPEPDPNLPIDVKKITVGSGGQFDSLRKALDEIWREYGNSAGTIKCNIEIQSGYVITEQLDFAVKNLSWITITSIDSVVNIDISKMKKQTTKFGGQTYFIQCSSNAVSPIISFNIKSTGNVPNTAFVAYLSCENSTLSFSNVLSEIDGRGILNAKNSTIYFNDVHLNIPISNSIENYGLYLENTQVFISSTQTVPLGLRISGNMLNCIEIRGNNSTIIGNIITISDLNPSANRALTYGHIAIYNGQLNIDNLNLTPYVGGSKKDIVAITVVDGGSFNVPKVNYDLYGPLIVGTNTGDCIIGGVGKITLDDVNTQRSMIKSITSTESGGFKLNALGLQTTYDIRGLSSNTYSEVVIMYLNDQITFSNNSSINILTNYPQSNEHRIAFALYGGNISLRAPGLYYLNNDSSVRARIVKKVSEGIIMNIDPNVVIIEGTEN